MPKKKKEETEIKQTTKGLSITDKELANPMIRRKICELVTLRAGFHSTEPFFPISEAELEVIKDLPLFTPIKDYGTAKYPKEAGKYRSQRVCII